MTILSLSLVLACGDKDTHDSGHEHADADTDTDADSDTDADADTDSDADTDAAWADMDQDQRKTFMWTTFEPTMEGHFNGYSAEYWPEMGCEDCHAGANEEDYSLTVSALDPGSIAYGEDPWMDFMFDTVTPSAVEMFGYEPYNPDTGEGFGCYGCHAFPQ